MSSQQLDLPLEIATASLGDESEENLIELAKMNNDAAIMELYGRYKNLLFGKFISRLLNFDFKKSQIEDTEDAQSIIRVIFMESIYAFTPGKAKFSTYLTNRIKWKFRTKLFAERLIPVGTGRSVKEVKELLDKTNCALVGSADMLPDDTCRIGYINFQMGGEDFKMPITTFIDGPLIETCQNTLDEEEQAIYFNYLKNAIDELHGAITKTALTYGLSQNHLGKMIRTLNEKVFQSLQIENVSFTQE